MVGILRTFDPEVEYQFYLGLTRLMLERDQLSDGEAFFPILLVGKD